MASLQSTDVAYLFGQMNRCLLVEKCRLELHKAQPPKDSSKCSKCNVSFVFECATADLLCRQCGIVKHILTDDVYDHSTASRYNKNPVHHYATAEHYFQSLSDLACLGKKTIPAKIMNLCTGVLGRHPGVTNDHVFAVLQKGGHAPYYTARYDIAARLRGSAEVKINSKELELIRFHYMRYNRQFMNFQCEERIGDVSRRGKLRLYWPVRYIMKRMFLLIGRLDVVKIIKGIAGKSRKDNYDTYWAKLEKWVNHSEEVVGRPSNPVGMKKLKESRRIFMDLQQQ